MLSASTKKIVQCLQRSFNTNARCVAYAALPSPLTEPLEDEPLEDVPVKIAHSDVQITTLDNGVKVASCDHGGPVSKVVVAVQAGSRFESGNIRGLSHFLKNGAFVTNGESTGLHQARVTQLIGGSVECSNSRELISRKGAVLRTNLDAILGNIAPAILKPVFSQWDFAHVVDACKADVASLDCAGKNLELLHEAAYRTGLGNSVYCKELKLGGVVAGDVLAYAKQLHVGERVTVVGSNCDHGELVQQSKDALGLLPSGEPSVIPAQAYIGGEVRLDTSVGLTYASLVGPGAGLLSDDLPAFAVLQRILHTPSSIKWGSNTVSSSLNRAVGAVTQEPFSISALNLSYSDAGLFGFHAVATPSAIGAVLQAARNQALGIASGELSSEVVERAINQLKASVLIAGEGSEGHIDDLLNQVAFTGTYVSASETLNKIDAVSLEKVVQVAHQCFSAQGTLVVTGDSTTAPYLDEL